MELDLINTSMIKTINLFNFESSNVISSVSIYSEKNVLISPVWFTFIFTQPHFIKKDWDESESCVCLSVVF